MAGGEDSSPSPADPGASAQLCGKSCHNWTLAKVKFRLGRGERDPGGAVDFGNGQPSAGPRWPVDLDAVGDESSGIEIAFEGECDDDLAARLLEAAQRNQRSGRNRADLLAELAAGGSFWVFARVDSPLGIDQPASSLFAQNGPPG